MEGRIKPSRCPSAPPATRLEAQSKAWTYGPNGCSASRSRWDLKATVAMAISSEAIGACFAIHSARRFKSPLLHHYSRWLARTRRSCDRMRVFAAMHESGTGPSLPIGEVRFDGEFRRDSGLVVLTSSFVEIDPERSFSAN